MDQEDLQATFEEKYEEKLGMSFDEWYESAPKNEDEAYARCMEIDRELNATYDDWFESTGNEKEELGDYRDRLKAEYDMIEEMYALESIDRNW